MKITKDFFICMILAYPFLGGCNSSTTKDNTTGFQLVWQDEFEKQGLPDTNFWSYDTAGNKWQWGNNELQFYTYARPENAYVSEGTLKIIALKENFGGRDYTSARLITKNKGDWKYGKFEIRARLPKGRGTWPAIWMLPTDWEYGRWPDSGEIDIMEYVGYDPDTVVACAHTELYNHGIGTHKNGKIYLKEAYRDFHTHTLEWEENEYRVYLDDIHYYTFKNENTGPEAWPFDKRFHLILNVAIGGNWGGKMGVDDDIFPAVMEVDYVRVYQKTN